MIDLSQQINAVARQVGARVLAAGEARTVIVSQTYAAAVDDVWDACTNPERIPRWFLPVSGDLRLGGRYQFEGNAGGTIERCDPPRSVEFTMISPGPGGPAESIVRFELNPAANGGTSFVLIQSGMSEEMVAMGKRGWIGPLDRLERLAGGR